ncbi:MAG: metallophosphoesterase family protein [Thiolinea sp.]
MNLGELHGEVLIFGGNYSNLQATLALKAVAEQRSIPPEQVICTGDIVAYCAEPEETVNEVRDWGIPVVMGNCEESLGFDADDCGCGFAEGTACAVLSDSWFNFSRSRVSAANKAWMRNLPRTLSFSLAGKRFQVVHGSVSSINRFVFASLPEDVFRQEFSQTTADIVIGGHAGIPFARQCGQQYWLNGGVIGMPANDGTADTWYMLLTAETNAVRASWHRLQYEADRTKRVMQERGLNTAYAAALQNGLWPSMDVLPETERQQQGLPLHLPPLVLS